MGTFAKYSMMRRRFKAYDNNAVYLLPPAVGDWIPEDHLARFIHEIVESFDLSEFYRDYEKGRPGGSPPYHPALVLKLIIYGYCTGVFSSRKIERATYEVLPFRFLAADQHPDHDTIAAFRERHVPRIKGLFSQVLAIGVSMGLVKLGQVAIDGTKIEANASKRQSVEIEKIDELIQATEELVGNLLARSRQADSTEEVEDHKLPKELSKATTRLEKLKRAKTKVDEARERKALEVARLEAEATEAARLKAESEAAEVARLEAEADAAKAARLQTDSTEIMIVKGEEGARDASQPGRPSAGRRIRELREEKNLTQQQLAAAAGMSRSRVSSLEIGSRHPSTDEIDSLATALQVDPREFPPKLKPERQRNEQAVPVEREPKWTNLTDDSSGLMKPKKTSTSLQGYNCQIVVDKECQFILATGISNDCNDKKNFCPMVEATLKSLQALPPGLLSQHAPNTRPKIVMADAGYCSIANITSSLLEGIEAYVPPERRSVDKQNPDPEIQKMREKVSSVEGKELYRQRSQIVEPPFSRIKTVLQFTRFSLRGILKVSAEWDLVALCQNCLKAFIYGWR